LTIIWLQENPIEEDSSMTAAAAADATTAAGATDAAATAAGASAQPTDADAAVRGAATENDTSSTAPSSQQQQTPSRDSTQPVTAKEQSWAAVAAAANAADKPDSVPTAASTSSGSSIDTATSTANGSTDDTSNDADAATDSVALDSKFKAAAGEATEKTADVTVSSNGHHANGSDAVDGASPLDSEQADTLKALGVLSTVCVRYKRTLLCA
jgi:hypothetical protein